MPQTLAVQKDLETRIERLNYNMYCKIKVGVAQISFTQTGKDYVMRATGETSSIIGKLFFNRVYNFQTNGSVDDNTFLPVYHTYSMRNKQTLSSAEIVHHFNFKNLDIRIISYSMQTKQKKVEYDKTLTLPPEARDVLSTLMEIRAKPIEKERDLIIVDKGIQKRCKLIYEGLTTIDLNDEDYSVHKFKLVDRDASLKEAKKVNGVQLYLYNNPSRTPLKLCIQDTTLGEVKIDFAGKKFEID